MNATFHSVCTRCGRAKHEHDAKRPSDRDATAWDRYVSAGCGAIEQEQRLEEAVQAQVSPRGMLAAQQARHARLAS